MYAVTSRGIGVEPSMRRIKPDWALAAGEFVVETFEPGMVLAEDEASLRQPTQAEIDAEAAIEEEQRQERARRAAAAPMPKQMDAAIESTRALRAQREAIAAATTIEQLRAALLAALEPNPVIDDVLERTPPRGRT